MEKLIKLSDTHYIGVDDSEIKEGDWIWYNKTIGKLIFDQDDLGQGYELQVDNISYPIYDILNIVKKITHSTQPLESSIKSDKHDNPKEFVLIKPLSLSEIEEAILGYSVVDKAQEIAKLLYNPEAHRNESFKSLLSVAFQEGFEAHKELVKDKLFIIEDLKDAFNSGIIFGREGGESKEESFNRQLKNVFPKTEWDVEFDEQGKLKLI